MDWPGLFWKRYLDQSITEGNAVWSCLSEILQGKPSCNDKALLHIISLQLFPLICLKPVSQKRPKSVLDTDKNGTFRTRAGTNTPSDEYDTYREYRVANTICIANTLFLRG